MKLFGVVKAVGPPPFTVLFVEDDSAVRDFVVDVLRGKGLGVFAAADGYDALRVLAAHHVDVLFTDIILPGMDGVQLASRAKSMRPGLKVLFATGYAGMALRRGAMRYGAVLFKPVRAGEIVRQVEMLRAVT
jgi:CheY-like chemotaxis protein